jgi:hypothetical protein
MSKPFPKEIDKYFDVSFSSALLGLSRFRVFHSDGSSTAVQKSFTKNRVERFLQINRQIIQNRFFVDLFYHIFGRFSVRGFKNTTKKQITHKSDPGPVLASDPPIHHGGHRLFFLPAPVCRVSAPATVCRVSGGYAFVKGQSDVSRRTARKAGHGNTPVLPFWS